MDEHGSKVEPIGSGWSRSRVSLCLFVALCTAGCAPGRQSGALSQPMGLPSAARGDVFAQQSCAACHAVRGEGPSPDRRAPPFGTLAGKYVGVSLQRKLTEIAETGHYNMPALLVHTDDVDDIAAYLDSLNRLSSPPRPPASADRDR